MTSPRVRGVRALRSRNGRRKSGTFLVEGPQAIASALLAAPELVRELYLVGDTAAAAQVHALAAAAGVAVTPVTAAVLAAMAETEHPQGVVAVCDQLPGADLGAVMSRPGPVVVLDGVSDPGNVGNIIRTADAAGAAGVVLTHGSCDPHGGKVVRATAGSLFHLPVATGVGIAEVVAAAHAAKRVVAVTTPIAQARLFEAVDAGQVGPATCWVLGSEAHGVTPETLELADLTVAIPMVGRAESLNAATAAAVVLYVGLAAGAIRQVDLAGTERPDDAAVDEEVGAGDE